MTLSLMPQDRVQLTRSAVAFYGGAWPHFVPQGQGGGKPGTLIEADENRPHDPRAAARPYLVRWDNGIVNSYREEDLARAEEEDDEEEDGDEEGPGNIVPFGKKF